MKNFKVKWLLLSIILSIASINTALGWGSFYMVGNYQGSWDASKKVNLSGTIADGKYFLPVYHNGSKNYFRLHNGSSDYGPSSSKELPSGGEQGGYNGTSDSWYISSSKKGILCICIDQTGDGREWYPWVWSRRADIYLKHTWSSSSWTYSAKMTDNEDGTYTLIATYPTYSSDNGYNYSAVPSTDGGTKKDMSLLTPTKVGSPASGNNCQFDLNTNTGALTITKLCNVSYHGNGNTSGSVPAAQNNNKCGASMTLRGNTNSLAKTGYTLSGWNTANDGSGTHYDLSGSLTPSTETSITLYAEWTQGTTVDKNGGSANTTYTAIWNKTSIAIASAPTRTGYTLNGYYTESGCSNKIAATNGNLQASVTVSSTTWTNSSSQWAHTGSAATIYAGWTAKTYSITLDKNHASAASDGSATATYDGGLSSITAPTYTGYHVVGYYKEVGLTNKIANGDGSLCASTDYTDESGNWTNDGAVTLYAKWAVDATSYSLTFAPGSDYTSMGSVSATVNGSDASSGSLYSEDASVVVTSNPGTHNRTAGWYSNIGCTTEITGDGAPGTNDTYSFSLSGNTTVYVKFEVSQTDITLNKNGGSTGATDVTATHGEVLPSFTAHARSRYTLQGYYTESSGGTKVVNANGTLVRNVSGYTTDDATPTWNNKSRTMTLYAQWSEDKEAISMSVNYDHGTSSYTATAANPVGIVTTSQIKASKPNSAHYTFAGWDLTNLTVESGDADSDTIITVKKTSADGGTPAAVAKYNEVLTQSTWVLKGGSLFGGTAWSTEHAMSKKSGESTSDIVYLKVKVTAKNTGSSNDNYKFKIYKKAAPSTYYGLTADGTQYYLNSSESGTEKTLSSSGANIEIRADVTGTYEIKLDYSDPSSPKLTVQFPSLFLKGDFNSWNNENKPFDENGVIRINLTAATHEFKVRYNGQDYGCNATMTTSTKDYYFSKDESTNCKIKVTTAGVYTFGWDDQHQLLTVYYPSDTTKAKLTASEYIYFDTRTLGSTTGWNAVAFSSRFWFKNYASAIDFGHVDCAIGDTVEQGIYYAKVPANNYLGQIQINRMATDFGSIYNTANKVFAVDRSVTTYNCLVEQSGHSNDWDLPLIWKSTTYCPPMKTAVLADNGTTKLAGSGTKDDPYQIAVSSKIKVTAASSTAFNDDAHMTHKYHFYNGAESLSDQTDATYELTASVSTNVTYKIVVKPYNTYNSQSSTKRIKSDTIYYKTVPSYTITYDANGAHSGEAPVDGNRYISGYNATALSNSGSLAKEGYTFNGWNESEDGEGAHHAVNGPITISSANVVLYAEWVDDHTYYFSGATDDDWSTASNWTKGLVPNDLANTIYILKPVEIPASTTIKAAAVNIVTGGTYTRPYSQGTVADCAGHLSIAAGGELVIDGELRRVADASDLETKVHTEEADLYIGSDKTHGNGALVMKTHDGTNEAIVEFYTKSHGDLAADQRVYAKNQFIGTPFNDCNDITYNYHNSWVYGVDYSGSAPAWKRVNGGEGMDPFKGYCVISADAEDHVYWMGGTLVASSNQTIGLHYLGSLTDQKENLLANSWTAPIRIQSFVVGDFTNADATIYIFNTGSPTEVESASPAAIDATSAGQWITIPISSGSWGGKTPTVSVIPSMQSFSIYSNNEDPSKTPQIKLDYDHLVLTPAKNGTAAIVPNRAPKADGTIDEEEMGDPEVLRLFVRGTSGFGDNVIMLAREDFTDGFDNGWDGRKVAGAEVAPQMYALTTAGNMAYNCVPDMEGTVLSFTKGTEDATYTFSFEYEGDDTWYLNDLKEQTSTLISELDTYTFTSMASDNAARFVISHTPIANTPTAIENGGAIDGANVRKLMIDGTLYIIRGGQMFTADGQVVK